MNTDVLQVGGKAYSFYSLKQVEGAEALPYSLRVVLENVLRNATSAEAAEVAAKRLVAAAQAGAAGEEIEFAPARVLFQDFTGVPVFVDFAVMREACASLGGDPARINPLVPCDLVIDHSVIADVAGSADALEQNMDLEFARNRERYDFLKWSQQSFNNVSIVPPGQGICHQMNAEVFGSVVLANNGPNDAVASVSTPSSPFFESSPTEVGFASECGAISGANETLADSSTTSNSLPVAYFDTVVGTDSHTPTVNGIGVLGWGVGGIEAEAAALGQPIPMLVPRVIGVELTGELAEGVSAMDVALTFAEMLRAEGVVGCFVECFGEGVSALSATQRACISNMTPEYGSTCTLFPVDERTIEYLQVTGRSPEQVALVEAYAKAQGLWAGASAERGGAVEAGADESSSAGVSAGQRIYSKIIHLDLASVRRSIAGPSRPHDRFDLAFAPMRFADICEERGVGQAHTTVQVAGQTHTISDGAIAIAAITSCTTATDPAMMVAAGIIAKKAADAGLTSAPWVKTILAPGSRATELLLQRAGLLEGLQQLGFYTCGFGCMSCIGNSGPLSGAMHEAAREIELAAVLSGNRNFEGRISPDVAQNYLMPPAAVVAYALAGSMDYDFAEEPVGISPEGEDVFLEEIWPTNAEIEAVLAQVVNRDLYAEGTKDLARGGAAWEALGREASSTFSWDDASTYVRRAPYFNGMPAQAAAPTAIQGARVLAYLGDFITTDHISPAGSIAADSAAAAYLREHGVVDEDFNTYGARRGNHEVMMRGTFANVKLENKLAEGRKGGWTRDALDGEIKLLFEAAQHYEREGVPSIVLAGKMYGSGSSRDWAAKGPMLLGVRAAFAESFERIHRSNLIGMGVLPLQFIEGESAESLGLDGTESFDIAMPNFAGPWPQQVQVRAMKADGTAKEFAVTVRIDTPTEAAYYQNGGILQYVLRNLVAKAIQ